MAISRCLLLAGLMLFGETLSADEPAPVRVVQVNPVNLAPNAAVKVVPLAQARQQALRQLVEAQSQAAQAIKALAEAQKSLIDAQGTEQKATAAKQVAEAKQKLDAAQKAVEARMDAAEATAVPRMVVTQERRLASVVAAADDKDPEDPVERMLLLAPGGPLIVEARITVEGKPFRMLREDLIETMLTRSDKNNDGKTTWEEAFNSWRFTFGRIRASGDQQKERLLGVYDPNKNGLVDREEARRFFANTFRIEPFSVSSGLGQSGGRPLVVANGRVYSNALRGDVNLIPLLDVDNDEILSPEEIAAAGDRLKSRDADDNDLLYPQEVTTNTPANSNRLVVNPQAAFLNRNLAVAINASTSGNLIHRALAQHYNNSKGQVTAEKFSPMPGLFQSLDANHNGILEEAEALKLKDLPPHLELAVDLGPKGKGVKLLKASEEFQNRKDSADLVALELPRVKLNATLNRGSADYTYGDQLGETYISRFDTDKNGYLDTKELAGNYARMMEMWDLDEDGKVFAKEIVESNNLMRAPQATQVRAAVTYDGNSLFQALDQSGDNRLSLREMRTAPQQLKPFDKNKDGRITPEEVPVTLGLTFVLGYGSPQAGQPANPAQGGAPKKDGHPEWFTRMDRNGDGDLTLKEFLGDKEQFQKLDSNQDGFIEPKEAQAAGE